MRRKAIPILCGSPCSIACFPRFHIFSSGQISSTYIHTCIHTYNPFHPIPTICTFPVWDVFIIIRFPSLFFSFLFSNCISFFIFYFFFAVSSSFSKSHLILNILAPPFPIPISSSITSFLPQAVPKYIYTQHYQISNLFHTPLHLARPRTLCISYTCALLSLDPHPMPARDLTSSSACNS